MYIALFSILRLSGIWREEQNRYVCNETVRHKWKLSEWNADWNFKLVFLPKSEFQNQGKLKLIGLFGFILLSISQNDMMQQALFWKEMQFLFLNKLGSRKN